MFQQLKLDLKLNWKDLTTTLYAILGLFLIGFILVNVIMRVESDPGDWFCLGTLLALGTLGFMVLFGYGFGYPQSFQLALSMGRTRGAFMVSYALRLLLQTAVAYLVILCLHQVELALYSVLFPDYGNDAYFTFLTQWKIMVPVALGLMILAMFLGAIYGNYGKKGLWLFYILWFAFCFIGPRFADLEEGSANVLDQAAFGMLRIFRTIPPTVWAVMGLSTAALMVVGIVVMGKRQMVR